MTSNYYTYTRYTRDWRDYAISTRYPTHYYSLPSAL